MASDWKWYAGRDDEFYACGPFDTREDAIAEGMSYFSDERPLYIVEAVTHAWRFSASDVVEAMIDNADDLFDFEHASPERTGTGEDIKASDAELQILLDAWLDKWRHTFTEPNLFAGQRNAEIIPAANPEDEAA